MSYDCIDEKRGVLDLSHTFCLLFTRYLDPDLGHLLEEEMEQEKWGGKFQKLNHAIAGVVSRYIIRLVHYSICARLTRYTVY